MASPETTVVHLLRHGQVHNPDGILYGRLPGYSLSELGLQMAQVVAEHLQAHDIVHIVSSPLDRAIQTAQPLADRHGLGITVDGRVIEAGNAFQGQSIGGPVDLLRRPKIWPKLLNPLVPSWGETYLGIAERMAAAVEAARVAAAGHEAVVVSHQLPIWTLRSRLEGRRLWHDPRSRECALASLTSLHYLGSSLSSIVYTEPAGQLLAQVRAEGSA